MTTSILTLCKDCKYVTEARSHNGATTGKLFCTLIGGPLEDPTPKPGTAEMENHYPWGG